MKLDEISNVDLGRAFDRLETVGYVRPSTIREPEALLREWQRALGRIRCTVTELDDAITAFQVADRKGYWPKPFVIVDSVLAARAAMPTVSARPAAADEPDPRRPFVHHLDADGPIVAGMTPAQGAARGLMLATDVECPDPACRCLAFECWVPMGAPLAETRDPGPVSVATVRPRYVPKIIAWKWQHVIERHGYRLVSETSNERRSA